MTALARSMTQEEEGGAGVWSETALAREEAEKPRWSSCIRQGQEHHQQSLGLNDNSKRAVSWPGRNGAGCLGQEQDLSDTPGQVHDLGGGGEANVERMHLSGGTSVTHLAVVLQLVSDVMAADQGRDT